MIVCVMEIAGLYTWDLEKEEKPLCFGLTQSVTQNAKCATVAI